MKQKCEICGREIKGTVHAIFIPEKSIISFLHMTGYYLKSCFSCNLSFMAQNYVMSNKEIQSLINWIGKVNEKTKS